MHRLAIVLGALAIALVAPATARAADCDEPVEVIVWTENWGRVAEAFANDPAPCAEYWVSVPPRRPTRPGSDCPGSSTRSRAGTERPSDGGGGPGR